MKYAVITDTNVAKLYGPPDSLVVPAGESSKSLHMIEQLAAELSRRGYGRDTTIVALGGGMITDLAGFLAATFCRGVPLILIPTTLLAMVDAAIGGKTAVNLSQGKNLLGSTTFPEKVIVHLPFLNTLPDIEWENGLIEVLKVGLLFDPELFFHLSSLPLSTIASRAIEAKRRIVAQDPYDKGCRALLNLGHTMGHALEVLSNYTLSHGQAVSAGIVLEARLSHAMGILPLEDLHTIEARFPPPQLLFEPQQLLESLAADKKTQNGIPHFVLLEKIGVPYTKGGRFCHPVDTTLLRQVLHEACLCPC
jgi:3-dehydroquinate synthase